MDFYFNFVYSKTDLMCIFGELFVEAKAFTCLEYKIKTYCCIYVIAKHEKLSRVKVKKNETLP